LADIEDAAEWILDEWGVGGPPPVDSAALAPLEYRDLLPEYAAHVRSFVDIDALRPLRVVADTANGMGGLVAPVVFDGLPFHVEILFPELDGTFPNHPADPIQPENLTALREAVLAGSADIGLAFDGDADRVFLVDERAEPVSGSLTTALVASSMLDKYPGSTVLYNCICSRVVPETIEAKGGTAIRTKVGHSFIKQVMSETGAVFGGEHSGHYYFRDNYRADSGIIAAMVVLELMSTAGESLSTLLAPFKRYADSGEINTKVDDPAAAVEALAGEVEAARGALGTVDRLDGLTVDRGDWWYNVRPSNTEPLLRLNVEAPDEKSLAVHVEAVEKAIERVTGH
jgi:phosphomannomutase